MAAKMLPSKSYRGRHPPKSVHPRLYPPTVPLAVPSDSVLPSAVIDEPISHQAECQTGSSRTGGDKWIPVVSVKDGSRPRNDGGAKPADVRACNCRTEHWQRCSKANRMSLRMVYPPNSGDKV